MDRSLKQIFNNNYSALCNYAKALVKDSHTSEDIVQTVFIQLWENEKLLSLQDPAPYLLRCVKYKCLDYLKSSDRRNEVLMQALPEINSEEQQELREEDIEATLHYFASQLPRRMQEVFLLSRTEGKSYKEISEELEISIKTVENTMGAALKKLRDLLKKHQYLPLLTLLVE